MNLYLRLVLLLITARLRPAISLWDTCRTRFRVHPGDLDLLMHMNNGRYLTLMDLGRMDLMLRSGYWPAAKAQGWYPVVAGQSITFRRSLMLWDRFEICTRLLGTDERWIYLSQTFHRRGDVVADAVVRACFKRKSGGTVPVQEVLALAEPMPAERVVPQWVLDWSRTSGARENGV